jgi:hypothetical protein
VGCVHLQAGGKHICLCHTRFNAARQQMHRLSWKTMGHDSFTAGTRHCFQRTHSHAAHTQSHRLPAEGALWRSGYGASRFKRYLPVLSMMMEKDNM